MSDLSVTTPGESGLRDFFRNPGLPSVCVRLVLYLCLYLTFGSGLAYLSRPVLRAFGDGGAARISPPYLMVGEGSALGAAFLAAWILGRLERRSFGVYGLPLQRGLGKHFAQGALFGIAEISAILGALAALGYYHFGIVEIHGATVVQWALLWGVFFLIVALFEEFTFRGYPQFTLAQGVGFWPAAILLSLLFGFVHWGNPGETPAGLADVMVTGLFWSFTLRRTGTLWFAVGMHAAFDFGETFLYSVPDSGVVFPGHLSSATLVGPTWLAGGTAGPEASIFDFLVLLVFFYVFHRMHPAVPRAGPSDADPAPDLQWTTSEADTN